jgi:hypothetical protein
MARGILKAYITNEYSLWMMQTDHVKVIFNEIAKTSRNRIIFVDRVNARKIND